MEQNRARKRVVGWLVAGAIAWTTGALVGGLRAEEQGKTSGSGTVPKAFEDTVDNLTMDLTVQQGMLTAEGAPMGVNPPGYTIRLERRRDGSTWRTALSLRSLDSASVQSLAGPRAIDNPFYVSRLEYDEDGSAPRMYDARGRLMSGPTEADRARLGLPDSLRDPQWMPSAINNLGVSGAGPRTFTAGVLVATADGQKRRADLEQRFGARAGRLRGLDRFVKTEGAETHELLIVPETSLPAQLTVTEGGRLVRRAQFEYQPFGAGAIQRTRARGESVIPASGGARFVTDVTFSHVTVNQGGAR